MKSREYFVTKRSYENYLEDQRLLAELEPCPTLISDVLRFILLDVFGTEEPPKLTKALIQTVFSHYNEYELAQDNTLIEEMILAATESGNPDNTSLDENSFARALTADVKLYDVSKETRQSTFYEDVFGVFDEYNADAKDDNNTGGNPDNTSLDENSFARALTADVTLYDVSKETRQSTFYEDVFGVFDEYNADAKDDNNTGDVSEVTNIDENKVFEEQREEFIKTQSSVKRVFTFPSIDFMAETFRSRGHVIIVWLSFYLGYYLYFFGKMDIQEIFTDKGFGCHIGQGVYKFTIVMLVLTGIGPIYVVGLCSGNKFKASIWEILLGIMSIGIFIFFPAFYKFDAKIFR